jgi:hypothetical protein
MHGATDKLPSPPLNDRAPPAGTVAPRTRSWTEDHRDNPDIPTSGAPGLPVTPASSRRRCRLPWPLPSPVGRCRCRESLAGAAGCRTRSLTLTFEVMACRKRLWRRFEPFVKSVGRYWTAGFTGGVEKLAVVVSVPKGRHSIAWGFSPRTTAVLSNASWRDATITREPGTRRKAVASLQDAAAMRERYPGASPQAIM